MFSLKEFSEMRMAVSSRIFGIKVNGKKTDCFAPIADMLNHKRPRQTQWFYSDDLKNFVIQSLQDIQKGEEVKFYYFFDY
jgi:histone-lysine N-methyltransferase SETD3